jgi:acyl-CoA synthetase (NDP forming)
MSLHRLFNPQSVGLVGASADAGKLSGMIVTFLQRSGFAGRVYPINPRYQEIGGWRCYASVEALPETVDVLVVAVPAAVALQVLDAAGRRGVPFAVLMTGGFGEGASGAQGEERLRQLKEICARTGLRVVGPNIVGMVNFRGNLALTFADWYGRDTGQRGGVAILTHSGSVGGLIFSSLQLNRIGVDYWVGTGNEATLEIADFIEHLSGDAGLHTIVCFMEGVLDGRRFMQAAETARRAGKTIVVLKAGESADARRSTRAHTRKQSTDADIYAAAFRQLGVVQVFSLEELTYAVKLLAVGARRACANVGILSASGGSCSVIADHIIRAGLAMPELPVAMQQALATDIPDYGSRLNPVDLSADVVARREILVNVFATLANDTLIDAWVIFGRPIVDRYHADIRGFVRETGKLVLVSTGVPLSAEVEQALLEDHVAVLQNPDLCMRALGAIHRAGPLDASHAADWSAYPGRSAAPRSLDPGAADALLARYHLPPGSGVAAYRVCVEQDKDFGPVLQVSAAGDRGGQGAPRAVCILPASDEDLRATCEAIASDAHKDALLNACTAICRLYGTETDVAALAVHLSPDGGVRDAVLSPVEP